MMMMMMIRCVLFVRSFVQYNKTTLFKLHRFLGVDFFFFEIFLGGSTFHRSIIIIHVRLFVRVMCWCYCWLVGKKKET